jgi:type II secretion system protein E
MTVKKDVLKSVLKNVGLVNEAELHKYLDLQAKTKERLSSILVKNSLIKDKDTAAYIINLIGVSPRKMESLALPPQLVSMVSGKFAKTHRVIPVDYKDGILSLATDDPFNFLASENLESLLGKKLDIVLTDEKSFSAFFRDNYEKAEDSFTDLMDELSSGKAVFLKSDPEDGGTSAGGDNRPVMELVFLLIKEAVKKRASDIHLEPLEGKFRVRYRIDGRLQEVQDLPKKLQGSVLSRIKLMAGMDIAEKRLPQDGRIRIRVGEADIDMRVSTLPGIYGESVVLRILDRSQLVLNIEDLGLSAGDKKTFYELLNMPYGIILDTGPTGSGKTTTLYAALNYINRPNMKIITVEDPIEYQLSGINQVQVKSRIELTFANVLRSIVRQSPNVIMVGEIRDFETADIAIHAALTGHLVFSTLHTNDAASAITRLEDIGIRPYLLSSAVQAIIAQRLVRLICPACKVSYTPAKEELSFFELKDVPQGIKFYRGKGCPECNGTGYKGRIAVFEILKMTDSIREIMLKDSPANVIRAEATRLGMRTLLDNGIEKVISGITTAEEVVRVISE